MATKRKRSGAWAYTIRRANLLPQPVYLTFDDESEGDAYVRRLESLLDRGVVPAEFAVKKARALILRETLYSYLREVKVAESDNHLIATLDKTLGGTRLSEITYPWAEGWIGRMKREDRLAPGTIRHYVGALARCLDWAVRHGTLAVNPLRMLPKRYASYAEPGGREDVARDRRLSDVEETAIRAVLAAHPQPAYLLLFTLALETAMRMREMFTLTIDQVDLDQRTAFLERTKNGDRRQVPLSSVALASLREPVLQGQGLLFPFWNGTERPEKTTSRLSRQFQRFVAAAGVTGLHFHDLRHEATSRLYERTDLSDIEISRITGHKDLRVLRRYANLRGSVLAQRLW